MHLYKRLLLTKFPDSGSSNIFNPASVFIGFVSSRQFFSVVYQKVMENYKLNLLDINFDPPGKVFFFGEPELDQKETEICYSYAVAANLNGNIFYSPANLGNSVALLSAVYFKDALKPYPRHFFTQLVYTVYLLSFTFVARVKIFPSENDQENYNRFIEVFFDFYKNICTQVQKDIDTDFFEGLKKELLQDSSFFFFLFHYYKKLSKLFENKGSDEGFLEWMLGRTVAGDGLLSAFKSNYETTKYLPHSSILEQNLLVRLWPKDILIKHLFGDDDPILAVETLLEKVFPRAEYDPIINSFIRSDEKLLPLLQSLLEYKKYKYGFFSGFQNYIMQVHMQLGEKFPDDIDEMLSAIDNGDDISHFDIPEKIKRESRMIERLLNFYSVFLCGETLARGDSFYLRLFKPELLEVFTKHGEAENLVQGENGMLRAWVRFYVSLGFGYGFIDSSEAFVEVVNNIMISKDFFQFILRFYIEAMTACFFQDLHPKETKLTIKNAQLLDKFKTSFGEKISKMVKLKKDDFIDTFYKNGLATIGRDYEIKELLHSSIDETELVNLKDSLYKLDYWLADCLFEKLSKLGIKKSYAPSSLIARLGEIRETFFGLLLVVSHLQIDADDNMQTCIRDLFKVYSCEILLFHNVGRETVLTEMMSILDEYREILTMRKGLDDNMEFLDLFKTKWKEFIGNKSSAEVFDSYSIEDLLRFRNTLRDITYYNKRFLIPG